MQSKLDEIEITYMHVQLCSKRNLRAQLLFIASVVCTALLLLTSTAQAQPPVTQAQPRWDGRLDLSAIEHRLATEEVVESRTIGEHLADNGLPADFHNTVMLITLGSGLKAVFKPGPVRFAEVAAYRACKEIDKARRESGYGHADFRHAHTEARHALSETPRHELNETGHVYVPPTIFREINGIVGSLQMYVEPDPEVAAKKLTDAQARELVGAKKWSDVQLWRFVFGQWDITEVNRIIQRNGDDYNIALIDNEGIGDQQHVRYGDFPFVNVGYNPAAVTLMGNSFPFHAAETELNPHPARLGQLFAGFMRDPRIRETSIWLHRYWRYPQRDQLYNPIRYATWNHRLWIQYYTFTGHEPTYTDQYDRSTLEAYRRLTRSTLERIWREALHQKRSYTKLIDLTLERRDQVLEAASRSQLLK